MHAMRSYLALVFSVGSTLGCLGCVGGTNAVPPVIDAATGACTLDPIPTRPHSSTTPPAYDLHAADRQNCVFQAGSHTSESVGPNVPRPTKVKHVILLTMENHSFDNYYSDLPSVGVTDVDVGSPSATNPDPLHGNAAIPRFHDENLCFPSPSHDWYSVHQTWDDGALDGFIRVNNPQGTRTMGYYTFEELPYYYWLARTFPISDRYFASLLGPTLPNRYYEISGTSWGSTETSATFSQIPPDQSATQNIWYQVQQAGHTFQIYKSGFLGFANIYGTPFHGVDITQFDDDVASDSLADFSFLEPALYGCNEDDEHPPSDVQLGQQFVAHIVDTVMSNPAVWQSTVLIIDYDEHGGYWDHVAPPPACKPDNIEPIMQYPVQYHYDRLGFRVPIIIVSPFAKANYTSHFVTDHTSVTRFIENQFDLPAMTARDANAWPLLDMFDFDNPPFMTPPQRPSCINPAPDPAKLDRCTQICGKQACAASNPDAGICQD